MQLVQSNVTRYAYVPALVQLQERRERFLGVLLCFLATMQLSAGGIVSRGLSIVFYSIFFFHCQSKTLEGGQTNKDLTKFLANFFLSFQGISDPIVFFFLLIKSLFFKKEKKGNRQ